MPSPEFVDAVAWAVGSDAPRAVGRVMAHYGHAVPWWRVVRANGEPPQGHAGLALPRYVEESTPLRGQVIADGYRIALSSARLGYDHEIFTEAGSTP